MCILIKPLHGSAIHHIRHFDKFPLNVTEQPIAIFQVMQELFSSGKSDYTAINQSNHAYPINTTLDVVIMRIRLGCMRADKADGAATRLVGGNATRNDFADHPAANGFALENVTVRAPCTNDDAGIAGHSSTCR